MSSALSFSPHHGPLTRAGAGASLAFLGSLAACAFITSNPLLLAAVIAAAAGVALAAGARAALRAATRLGLVLAALIVAVNALVAQRGATVLVRGGELPLLGRVDVSAEALAEGGVLALRIWAALVVFAVLSARVDPDRLLALVRPIAARSALTATLIARLVPLAAADHARLRGAATQRGPAAAAAGRAALARRLLAGSLDRAVDVSATLELRGYGAAASRPRSPRRRHPDDLLLLVAGLGALAAVIVARVVGLAGFDAYPTTSLDAGAGTLAIAALLLALSQLPFALARARERGAAPAERIVGPSDA